MDPSTPRRNYNLRSINRIDISSPISRKQARNVVAVSRRIPVLLRKRVITSDENRCQKRQRTNQSHGPPFLSPDALHAQRYFTIEEQGEALTLSKLLSSATEAPFGVFGNLPSDVISHILNRAPYQILGKMAMTSKPWNNIVFSYVSSGSFRLRWLTDIKSASSSSEKQSEMWYSTGILVRLLTAYKEWDEKLSCLKSFVRLAYDEQSPIAGIGKMIYAFAKRPDESIQLEQIDDIVSMVFSIFNNLKNDLSDVITRLDDDRKIAGTENLHILREELEIRKKTLALFLSNGSNNPKFGLNKYFLSSMMKVYKEIHGFLPTSLFFLLFAPTTIHFDEEVINWHRFSEISVNNLNDAQELQLFSSALCALLECRNKKSSTLWTKNMIFNLIEEVTTYPNPWSMNTFVSLQVLEPELVPIGIVARMNRSHEDEAGDMICTMKMLLHRWKMDVQGVMEGVIDSINTVLKPIQRRVLFDRCWVWHQRNIDELRSRFGLSLDIRIEIESQMEVMPVLMRLL